MITESVLIIAHKSMVKRIGPEPVTRLCRDTGIGHSTINLFSPKACVSNAFFVEMKGLGNKSGTLEHSWDTGIRLMLPL